MAKRIQITHVYFSAIKQTAFEKYSGGVAQIHSLR
jgi:hypothetical protein